MSIVRSSGARARLILLALSAVACCSITGGMSESAQAATWANPEAGTPLRAEPHWGMRAKQLRLAGRWYRVMDIAAGRGDRTKDWIKISLGHRTGWIRRTYLDFRFGKRPPTCRDARDPSGWRPLPVGSTSYFLWNPLRGAPAKNASRAWGRTTGRPRRGRQD